MFVKKADGAYVYSIQLNQNKTIEASPPRGSLLRALSGVPNASKDTAGSDWSTNKSASAAGKPAGQKGDVFENNVAQDAEDVNEKFSDRDPALIVKINESLTMQEAKLTSNKAPTAGSDIRFSARRGGMEAVTAAVEAENAKLKEDVANLKELMKLQRTEIFESLTHLNKKAHPVGGLSYLVGVSGFVCILSPRG